MRLTSRHLCVTLVVLTVFLPSAALATDCADIADVEARACCERNQPQRSMSQRIRLTVADRKGTISNLAATLYWKRFEDGRARARVNLTDPPRRNGTAILLTESEPDDSGEPAAPEVVMYQPSERRDRLITVSALSGEMLGTDFSYEDFAHFYGTELETRITRLDDETHDGRTVIVLQSEPEDPEAAFDRGSTYSRVVTRFDAERCVLMTTNFFDEDDELRKELVATPAEVRAVGERLVPHEMVMHDRLEKSRTILTIESVEFDPDLKDRIFARSSLKRGR